MRWERGCKMHSRAARRFFSQNFSARRCGTCKPPWLLSGQVVGCVCAQCFWACCCETCKAPWSHVGHMLRKLMGEAVPYHAMRLRPRVLRVASAAQRCGWSKCLYRLWDMQSLAAFRPSGRLRLCALFLGLPLRDMQGSLVTFRPRATQAHGGSCAIPRTALTTLRAARRLCGTTRWLVKVPFSPIGGPKKRCEMDQYHAMRLRPRVLRVGPAAQLTRWLVKVPFSPIGGPKKFCEMDQGHLATSALATLVKMSFPPLAMPSSSDPHAPRRFLQERRRVGLGHWGAAECGSRLSI